eukprot:s253_g15.t1
MGSGDLEPSSSAMNNKRTVLCEHWLRGYCRNGTRCNFAHGATQLRRPEAVNGEAPPAKLLQWREQLAALPPGRQVSFEGLRATERYALHQLANEFQLTHMSTGVGDQRRLHILKPAPQESSQASQGTSSGRLSRAEQKRRKKERLRSQPSKQSTPGDLQTSTGREDGMEGESDWRKRCCDRDPLLALLKKMRKCYILILPRCPL